MTGPAAIPGADLREAAARGSFLLGSAVLAAWGVSAVAGVAMPGPELRRDDPRPAPDPDMLVSVVVPMRDEARNAAPCVASILASDHRRIELVVVDDESTDQTAAVARDAARGDPRVTVVRGAPLPPGWVGKPWACAQGAARASGEWLLFCDADVRLDPSAVRVLLADAAAHDAVAVSWVGEQELASFWERVVNPVVFLFIASLSPLPLARRPGSRIVAVAGGFLAFRRDAYDELGGHTAVSDAVVEDLALGRAAKRRFGRRYRFVWARELLSVRMYASLREIVAGWSKNVALGARQVGISPVPLVAGALTGGVGPWMGLAAWRFGSARAWPWALAAPLQSAALGLFAWRFSRSGPVTALTAPLGTAVVTGICARSWWLTATGRVSWRGRRYAAQR